MATIESMLPTHLSFLNDAAHLLRQTAPETSTHLMSRRNELMFEYDLEQTDVQRQHVCGACGLIMISGHESKLKIETDKFLQQQRMREKRKRRRASAPTPTVQRETAKARAPAASEFHHAGPRKILQCGNCNSLTNVHLPLPPPVVRRKAAKSKSKTGDPRNPEATSTKSDPRQPAESEAKPSANASSKKRAKNRKAGLQALLSQAQSSQSSRNLSLADFAKR